MTSLVTNTVTFTQIDNIETDSHKMTIRLPRSFIANDSGEVCLLSAYVYYSWRNITTAFNNKTMSYIWIDGTTHTVTFPDGYYAISDLNGYLEFKMKQNGHYLVDAQGNNVYFLNMVTNAVYYAVTLTVSVVPNSLPSGYTNPALIDLATYGGVGPQLVIGTNNFGALIGWAAGTYPSAPSPLQYQANSTLVPRISPVTSIGITCNLANNGSFSNNPRLIADFSPQVSYGGQIKIEPIVPIWFPIAAGKYDSITITFIDQSYRALAILDTDIVVKLGIRQTVEKKKLL